MQYEQRNPLPLPASGPYSEVEHTLRAVFDWRCALQDGKLLGLYEKGKRLLWNASELDWSQPVDLERLGRQTGVPQFINAVLQPPRPLSEQEALRLDAHNTAFLLSQFLHGEQGALLAAAKLVECVPNAEAKFFAAVQTLDEARHVEVYHRYLTEKLAIAYPVHPSLQALLDEILRARAWDMTFLGMQIMVEGLALAAFGLLRLMLQHEPLIQSITERVMADEARHVGFGVLALQGRYHEMDPTERREREQFVVEAAHLLHERLKPTMVFERLGWDVRTWDAWSERTPFMRGFRQMMFSKIVPNLKRLGLLTPTVREGLRKIGVLHYEHGKDSVEEPAAPPPEDLVRLLLEHLKPPEPRSAAPSGS